MRAIPLAAWALLAALLLLVHAYARAQEATVLGCATAAHVVWMAEHQRVPQGCWTRPVAGLVWVASTPSYAQFRFMEAGYWRIFWVPRATGDALQRRR